MITQKLDFLTSVHCSALGTVYMLPFEVCLKLLKFTWNLLTNLGELLKVIFQVDTVAFRFYTQWEDKLINIR